MAKRILITCTDSMMKQFLEPHVVNLVNSGYEVEIACSEVLNRFKEVQEDLGGIVKIHHLSLQRSPLAISAHFKGYRELKEIIRNGHFDLIWTNEPVMGVVTRLAAQDARKSGTKVLYMVHGFHFYKGAPLINWIVYYPIEKLMAQKADCICTINKEDYARAQKMKVDRVEYIHGVGIDTSRLHPSGEQKNLRKELGISDDAFIVLSVGELNKNKNQQVIIRAIAEINDEYIHYVLCGKGDQREKLEKLSRELGIEDRVHFLGYRKDVVDICSQADVFAMPSKREGLPVASLEAMYCGLPLVNSNIRGLSDVTENGVSGYVCSSDDIKSYKEAIENLKNFNDKKHNMSRRNSTALTQYYIENSKKEIKSMIICLLAVSREKI